MADQISTITKQTERLMVRQSLWERIFLARDGPGALRDIDALDLFKSEFFSELELLQTAKTRHIAWDDGRSIRWNDETCSQVLYGKKNPIVDCLLTQLLAIKWLCEGDDDKFRQYCCNFPQADLTALRLHSTGALKDARAVHILLILLVSVFCAKYAPLVYNSSGSDVRRDRLGNLPATVAYEALLNTRLRTAEKLDDQQQELFLECLRLTAKCELGPLACAELGPESLELFQFTSNIKSSEALDLCFILSTIQSECASYRPALIVGQLACVLQQLQNLLLRRCNKEQAYYEIIQHRSVTLERQGFRHLSAEIVEECATLRLITMGQCVSRSRAEWICRAFNALSATDRASLVSGLCSVSDDKHTAVSTLDMHILFEYALRQTDGSVDSSVAALGSLMRFLVRLFGVSQLSPGQSGIVVRECAEIALATVQSPEFRKDPSILDSVEITTPGSAPAIPDAASKADAPLPSTTNDGPSTTSANTIDTDIPVKTCRACSGKFTYTLFDREVTIICGVPNMPTYKAISYVWGEVTQLKLNCTTCSAVHTIPMETKAKFESIMQMVGPGTTVWLDAASIDQGDHQDITTQIAVMGDIYSKADRVCVLLPASDKQAFETLTEAVQCADRISQHPQLFHQDQGGEAEEEIGKVCQRFFALLTTFAREQKTFHYWQRAWTYQELALARDVDFWCEGHPLESPLVHVKYRILTTVLFLVKFILGAHQYASVKIGFTRGYALEYLTLVKRLFPHEGLFLSNEEIDPKEHTIQALFPHFYIDQLLGIRSKQPKTFKTRLSLMLDAFDTNQRQAKFEADLICCWASMCSIKYDYNKTDCRALALHKVLAAIRRDGTRVFSFHVNTEARLETDLTFIDYAKVHRLCNMNNKPYLLKAPIFSGQTDTVFHVQQSLNQPLELAQLPSDEVRLRSVKREGVSVDLIDLTNLEGIPLAFLRCVQGARADGMGMFHSDVVLSIMQALEAIPHSRLEKYVMALAQIPFTMLAEPAAGYSHAPQRMPTWAILPRNRVDGLTCEVARESQNGTLVLTAESTKGFQAVAYLTVTHGQSGTHLLPVDETSGEIAMEFSPPPRSDMFSTSAGGGLTNERMHVRIDFE